jgi:hypothetical protein
MKDSSTHSIQVGVGRTQVHIQERIATEMTLNAYLPINLSFFLQINAFSLQTSMF